MVEALASRAAGLIAGMSLTLANTRPTPAPQATSTARQRRTKSRRPGFNLFRLFLFLANYLYPPVKVN